VDVHPAGDVRSGGLDRVAGVAALDVDARWGAGGRYSGRADPVMEAGGRFCQLFAG
jgi:hypothetical protein